MLLTEMASGLRRHLEAQISMCKLQNPNMHHGSLWEGHQDIPLVNILGRLRMGGMRDNRWMLKQEFRKETKTEAGQTDAREGQRLDYFSQL